MRYLLDTHALVWALAAPRLLSQAAASVIVNEDHRIYVSAASAWEIATKVRLGKFSIAETLERDFLTHMANAGYLSLPISPEIALRAGRLTVKHKDPFDRILAAQALAEDIPIVSTDEQLDLFGVRRLW